MGLDSNFEAFIASWEDERPDDDHEVTFGNTESYARELHDRNGYSVLNDKLFAQTLRKNLRQIFLQAKPFSDDNIRTALKEGCAQYAATLQSFTGDMRPPVSEGGPKRPAHPGGWADRTTALASGYYSVVDGERTDYDYDGTAFVSNDSGDGLRGVPFA